MRRVTSSIVVAAGATSPVTNITSPDDNNLRTLQSVIAAPTAQGVVLTILRAGFQLEQLDVTRFGTGNEVAYIGEQYPAYILFQVQVQNTTGGSVTTAVTLEYEPFAVPGSRPAPNTPTL